MSLMADREKVIGLLQETAEYFRECRSNASFASKAENHFWELQNAANEAVNLLKEQEGVVPYIDIEEAKCPVCKVKLTRQELIGDDVLFEDFFDYCPHCGKPVLWEGR